MSLCVQGHTCTPGPAEWGSHPHPPATSPRKSPQQSPEGSRWTACPLLAACWDPRAHNCPQVCESAGVLRKFQHPPQGGSERCSEVRLEPQAGRWPSPFPAPRHLLLDALTAPHHLCKVTSEAPALGVMPGSTSQRCPDCPQGSMAAEKPHSGFRAASWGFSLGGGTRGLWQGA